MSWQEPLPGQGYPPQGQPQPGCPPQQPVYAAPPPNPPSMMNNTTIINNSPAPGAVKAKISLIGKFTVYRQLGDFSQLGKCQLGDFNLSDSLDTIFILIYFYLLNATNEQ